MNDLALCVSKSCNVLPSPMFLLPGNLNDKAKK